MDNPILQGIEEGFAYFTKWLDEHLATGTYVLMYIGRTFGCLLVAFTTLALKHYLNDYFMSIILSTPVSVYGYRVRGHQHFGKAVCILANMGSLEDHGLRVPWILQKLPRKTSRVHHLSNPPKWKCNGNFL